MAEALMTLQYEGSAVDSGAMDVRQLAPALLATADMMREAHALLEVPGPVPQVNIRATRPGSFIVDLLVADPHLYEQVLNLLTAKPTVAAIDLGTMVGFVVASVRVVKALGNKKIVRTEEPNPGLMRLIMEDGTTLDVPPEPLRLALDASYRRSMRGMVQPLSAEAGVSTLRVVTADITEIVEVTDVAAFEVPPAVEEDLGESESVVVLRPVNVAFTEGNKWRFSDGETTFHAAIQDVGFMQAVNLGTERFAKNDMLRVRLRTQQRRDAHGELHTERTVIQVLEHISGAVQLDLFAESASEERSGDNPSA